MTKIELAEMAMKMFTEFIKEVIPLIAKIASDVKGNSDPGSGGK